MIRLKKGVSKRFISNSSLNQMLISDSRRELFSGRKVRSCFLSVRARSRHRQCVAEPFSGAIKQEEIYLVVNYINERSAREETGGYVELYHYYRSHRSLGISLPLTCMINNKSRLLAELKRSSARLGEKRKAYWE